MPYDFWEAIHINLLINYYINYLLIAIYFAKKYFCFAKEKYFVFYYFFCNKIILGKFCHSYR